MNHRHKKKKTSKSSRCNGNGTPTRTDELRNDFWLPTIKRRRRFSSKEIKLLQNEFAINCSPCADKVEEIADLFSTDKKIITTWFQNKRAKSKKLQVNSPGTVSSLDDYQEQQNQKEDDDEEHYDFDDTSTELSNANTDMDSDTFHVRNGNTALTAPTCILHQQEQQHMISTLSSPHYMHKHLSDYLSTYRSDLYFLTMLQDQDDASTFFTCSSNSATHTTATVSDPEQDDDNDDDQALLYKLADSPLMM
ncbi:unnamed protein product [Mucor fragilis]